MKRNLLIFTMLAILGLLLGTHVANPARAEKEKAKPAPYVHSVVFYLNKDAPADAADGLIADAHKMLRKIPSVRDLRAGKPAEKATPRFAKSDYQVGLLVLFDNYDGLQEYLDHDLHKEYVQKHGPNIDMEKLLVFDYVNQEK